MKGKKNGQVTSSKVTHKPPHNVSQNAEYYNFNIASLYGLNNLRKLQYNSNVSQLSEIHRQLQTVSSSLISEVNFKYHHASHDKDTIGRWNVLDDFMVQKFHTLSIVTITWIVEDIENYSTKRVTWDHCVSQCIAALPKLHQKGILRPLLPPPDRLK